MGENAAESKWWYGVAIPAILDALVRLTRDIFGVELLLAQAAILSSHDLSGLWLESLGFAVYTIGYIGAILLTPVFGICLYLDARALQIQRRSWAPPPAFWGLVGFLNVVFLMTAIPTLTFWIGIVYLLVRYYTTPGDSDGTRDTGLRQTVFDVSQSLNAGTATDPSKWWYGIAIPALFVGLAGIGNRLLPELYQTVPTIVTGVSLLLTVVSFLFGTVILRPLFILSLYRDARALSTNSTAWTPNPWFWSGLGVGSFIIFLVTSTYGWTVIVAIAYLVQRHRRIGTP